MIKVNENITIPSNWSDLSPLQVTSTIAFTLDFLKGKYTLTEYRFHLLKAYTGYKRSTNRYNEEEREQINCNLFLLADMLKFPIRPAYKTPEYLEVLSPALKNKLMSLFPFEISETAELDQLMGIADKLEYYPVLNLNLKQNPMPQIITAKGLLTGAVFNIDKHGDVQTNITALQYAEAYSYYRFFIDANEPDYLNALVAILYTDAAKPFSLFEAQQRAKTLIQPLPNEVKMTVFYWFQSIMEWIFSHPVYSILYTAGKTANDVKINLGMAETIYTLSKEGYGTAFELGNETVIDFLNRQVKRLRDVVSELRAADVKPTKITQHTGLSIDTLKRL